MSVFKVTNNNSVVIYRIADTFHFFANDYLRGSFADFYQDGFQVGTECNVKAVEEIKEKTQEVSE